MGKGTPFWENMAMTMGPFQSMVFNLSSNSMEFKELSSILPVKTMRVGETRADFVKRLGLKIKVLRLDKDYCLEVVKNGDGMLGLY